MDKDRQFKTTDKEGKNIPGWSYTDRITIVHEIPELEMETDRITKGISEHILRGLVKHDRPLPREQLHFITGDEATGDAVG